MCVASLTQNTIYKYEVSFSDHRRKQTINVNACFCHASESCSGWETFEGFLNFAPGGELVCRFRTFHRTWVSVTRYGEVTAVAAAGEGDQIQILPQGNGKYALKALWGNFYLSAAPGPGEKLVTTGAVAGPNELFVIRNLPE